MHAPEAPADCWKVPGPQGTQPDCPAAGWYPPGAHGAQPRLPADAEKAPAGHGTHAVPTDPPQPADEKYAPAGQATTAAQLYGHAPARADWPARVPQNPGGHGSTRGPPGQ